jgi:hypothetical protein
MMVRYPASLWCLCEGLGAFADSLCLAQHRKSRRAMNRLANA